jgi:hypothetical protein
MTIRTACISAGAAALALPAFAGSPKNLPLQQLGNARHVMPSRAASYTVVNGRMVLTSDWVTLGATTRDIYTCSYDSIELDLTGGVLGAPTDQTNPPGPTGCLDATIPNGNRWYFGAAYHNPFISSDIGAAAAGVDSEGVGHAWYIDVGDAEPDGDADGLPDSPLFIAIQQFEDMDVVGCTDDGSTFINGVIYDFSGNAWDPAFYNYTTISLNGSGLFHTMPADGSGGYQVIYGIAFDPVTNIITLPTAIDPVTLLGVNIQPMLWGTGANEFGAPDDGRCGADVDGQYDDDAPTDGVHDLALECYSYLFGVCPDPLACATGFYHKASVGCACLGDINGDGIIDIADLALFLSVFGSAAAPGDCADMNGDGIIDIADLALFLSGFGSICP